LGAFLLTAPAAFVLLPLALLLVTTRPARLVTILWIVVGAAWSGLWLAAPGPLAEQVLKGWTVVTSGVFLLLVLDGRRRPADAAVTAVLTASLAALTWLRVFRVEFDSVMGDVLRIIWAQYRAIGDAAPGLRGQLADFSLKVADASVLIPGGMMLLGVAGCLLAWRWYHWFGDRPVGDTPGPFREFRFSDHLIWLLVLGLAGTILQVAGVLSSAAGWPVDLLVLLGGLYAARGLAVARSSAARLGMGLPLPLLLAALVFVLFLLPFALAALLGVGLADTWLDFRRRSAAAPGE
jgi:hypothetical protein